ncbi:MAG: hypothetical protein BM564_02860 [Bacteroidetes bacterium MedPE-SWsnd-G2]|nr:MAG: hypothetical protein BM564_02860 [Bacteroidetes bacterium MedPE-SWsnd-G2]
MKVEDLVGNYSIVGENQNDSGVQYRGTLSLKLDADKRIVAQWLIHDEQVQVGEGFFSNDILVINFSYQGENQQLFTGTVVYRCLSKTVLDGFWSESEGDPRYLGKEKAYRMFGEGQLLN